MYCFLHSGVMWAERCSVNFMFEVWWIVPVWFYSNQNLDDWRLAQQREVSQRFIRNSHPKITVVWLGGTEMPFLSQRQFSLATGTYFRHFLPSWRGDKWFTSYLTENAQVIFALSENSVWLTVNRQRMLTLATFCYSLPLSLFRSLYISPPPVAFKWCRKY